MNRVFCLLLAATFRQIEIRYWSTFLWAPQSHLFLHLSTSRLPAPQHWRLSCDFLSLRTPASMSTSIRFMVLLVAFAFLSFHSRSVGLAVFPFFMHFGLIFEYHSHRHIDSNFLGKCVWFWRYVFFCIHSYKNICACIYKEGEKGRECEGWVRVVVCVWREPQEISGYGNVGDVIYRFCRFCPIFVPAVAISFPQKMTFAEADILRCVWRLPP